MFLFLNLRVDLRANEFDDLSLIVNVLKYL